MSLAKVIEVIAEGKTIEGAIEAAVKEASDTVRNIKHVYVEGIQALIDDTKVTKYRVNVKVTFVVD
ncbi:MAG: dodecin family protein [Anaerolineales bacterium]|jgi:flavin-binding protein dodecin|nr:dodecin family protein [Anaerolineales bacterium]